MASMQVFVHERCTVVCGFYQVWLVKREMMSKIMFLGNGWLGFKGAFSEYVNVHLDHLRTRAGNTGLIINIHGSRILLYNA